MAADALDLLKLLLTCVSGVVYAYVATRLWKRPVEGPARLAAKLFATWWALLGGLTLLSVLTSALAAAGVNDVALYLTLIEVDFLVICIAFWALLYYLVYVLTGSRKVMAPIATFYALFYVWLLFVITSLHIQAVKIVGLSYQPDPQPDLDPIVGFVLVALLLGPVLVASVGYLRLYFRVEGRTQRYRIGLIAVTLFAWFGSSALATVLSINQQPWWSLVSSALGLAAALSIYFAYQPPAFVRRRFGILAVGEERGA